MDAILSKMGQIEEMDTRMGASEVEKTSILGFLTVVANPHHGLFGGYLLLNRLGRPLEFHCTAPIRPNRAQEILYGPTLEGFLYGEQIGRALLDHATAEPGLICTDQPPALCIRQLVEIPVVLVLPAGDSPENSPSDGDQKIFRFAPAHHQDPQGTHFLCGRNRLAVAPGMDCDRQRVVAQWRELAETFDLAEPFTRIREAIAEAQRAAA
jgi:hypothetical protein